MWKKLGIFCLTVLIIIAITLMYNMIMTNSKKVDFEKLQKDIEAEYKFDLNRLDNLGIKNTLEISTDKIVDSLALVPVTSDKIERCIIFKVKHGTEKSYIDALENYAIKYKQDTENYLVDQVKYIDEKKIGSNYNYVYMVIGENKDKVASIIETAIK